MDKMLKNLFDYQKFQGNKKLKKLINECGSSIRELNIDELDLVNAAGDVLKKNETEDNKK